MNESKKINRSFNLHILNIKVLPKDSGEDNTLFYAEKIKQIHKENIAINTRGDKFMEIRTINSYNNDDVLFGKLIYYTVLDTKDWYNKRSNTIEEIEINDGLFPNAKETEFYFVPNAHRFCFITKSNSIALSQIVIFLKEAFQLVLPKGKEIHVSIEVKEDIIDRILNAPYLSRIDIELSYSNNDLGKDFEEFFDNDMREGQIEQLNLHAKSFKSESINLSKTKILNSAVKLSKSNGYTEAVIKNEEGKNEIISTNEYPRKELIFTTNGNESKDIFNRIMSLFPKHEKEE